MVDDLDGDGAVDPIANSTTFATTHIRGSSSRSRLSDRSAPKFSPSLGILGTANANQPKTPWA